MVLTDWLKACRLQQRKHRLGRDRRRGVMGGRTIDAMMQFSVGEALETRCLLTQPIGVILAPGADATIASDLAQGDPNAFRLGSRWSTTIVSGGGLAEGQPTTLRWGVVGDGTALPSGAGESATTSSLISFLDGIYPNSGGPDLTTRPWFNIFTSVFTRLGELSGLTYEYMAADDGVPVGPNDGVANVRPDVRIGGHRIDGQSNILAYNYFPDVGDMVIDTGDSIFYSNTNNNSLAIRNVLTHELGHGVGLFHVDSSSSEFLMEPFVNLNFDGPQLDDIAGLQRHYGDNYEKTGGDSFGTAVPLGKLTGAAPIEIGKLGDLTVVQPNEKDFVSIDDESDNDYFTFTIQGSVDVNIDLVPRGTTYLEGAQNGLQSPLNLKTQSDLSIELLNSKGTVIASADANGLGGSEAIPKKLLTTGTYAVRVVGKTADKLQFYGLKITGSDLTPPIADIVDVTPDPRNTNAGLVTVTFDEDVTGVDINDFALTNGATPVSLAGVTVNPLSGTDYELDLSSVTNSSGSYSLLLKASGSGIRNLAGLSMTTDASDSWVNDQDPPLADIVDVTPDPRQTAITGVTVNFNEPVTGVSIGDFKLFRNSLSVPLVGKSVVPVSTTQYLVNLTGLTANEGTYTLQLKASGSGITDVIGNTMSTDAFETWSVDLTGPTADIVDVTPDPRTTTAGLVTISFNEGVTGVTADDFTLTRNGSPLNVAGATVTEITPSEYALDLSILTNSDGTFELTLNSSGTGITDLAGNPIVGGAVDSWVRETVRPSASIVPVSPDPRNSSVSLIQVNFSEPVFNVDQTAFALRRNGLQVSLSGATVTALSNSQYTVDLAALTTVDGSYEFFVNGGSIGDQAGNSLAATVSDTFLIDTTAPGAMTLVTPSNGAFTNDTTPSFAWTAAADANGVTYELQIASDSGFSSIVDDVSGIATPSKTLTADLADGSYFWRIIATDIAGNSTTSSSSTFTVDTVAPEAFALLTPSDQSFVDTLTPTFIWEDANDSQSSVTYKLEISSVSDFSAVVLTKSGLSGTTYTLQSGEELSDEVTYYWRVTAIDAAGNFRVSSSFEVTPDLTPPRIQVAFDGSNVSVINLDFGSVGRVLRVTQSGSVLTFFTPNVIDEIDAFGSATQVDKHTVTVNLGAGPTQRSVSIDLDDVGDQVSIETNLSLVNCSLLVSADSVNINAANSLLATGLIQFYGDVTVDSAALTISGGDNVYFDGTINSASGEVNSLTVNTAYSVGFNGSIGAVDRLSKLSTSPVGFTYLGGDIFLNGGDTTFGDYVVLVDDVTIDQDGAGAVVFNDAVDGNFYDGRFALTVDTSGGETRFRGGVNAYGGLEPRITVDNLALANTTYLSLGLNGTSAGVDQDAVFVNGSVALNGAALNLDVGYNAAVNDSFVLVSNDGSDAVSGTFAGLSEGAAFNASGYLMTITYAGGDGNDVVATVTGKVKVKFVTASSTVAEEDGAGQSVVVQLDSSGVTLTEAVSIDVLGGLSSTATAGTDFTGTGTLTFGVGSADGETRFVTITPTNDALIEGDEVAALQLLNSVDVFVDSAAASHALTIDDNDSATLTVAATKTMTEQGGSQSLVVTMTTSDGGSGTATLAPGVSITANVVDATGGTATSGSDYTALTGLTVTFDNGAGDGATKSVSIAVLNDALVEGNETLVVGLSSLSSSFNNQVSLNPSTGTVIIDDNDTASLSIAKTVVTTEEGGAQLVTVTLTTSDGAGGTAALASGISLTADVVDNGTGTGISGADYSAIGTQSVTFTPGSIDGATRSVTISNLNDSLVEGDETVVLKLQNLASTLNGQAQLGNTSSTVTIDDNDTAELVLASSVTAIENGGAKNVDVTLVTSDGLGGIATLGSGVTLSATIVDLLAGSATVGVDYQPFGTQTVTFVAGDSNGTVRSAEFIPLNDSLIEGNESTGVALVALNTPLSGQASLGNNLAAVTIDDNDTATLSVALTGTVNESKGSIPVVVTMTTSDDGTGPATLAPNVTLLASIVNAKSGTASDLDVAPLASGLAAFRPGDGNGTTAAVTLNVVNDSLLEGSETVAIRIDSILNTYNDQALIGNATSIITITDDEHAEIAIVNDQFVTEGATATFEVTLKAFTGSGSIALLAPGVSVSANVVDLLSGTATTEDYSAIGSTTVTFIAGEGFGARRQVSFNTSDDNLIEGRETIVFGLQSSGSTLDGLVTVGQGGSVTITDNDTAVLRFVASTAPVAEVAGSQTITVILDTSDGPGGPAILAPGVSISATVSDLGGGTAARGSDFDFTSQVVTFDNLAGDGQTRTATMSVLGDSLIEGDEVARFRLQGLSTTLNGLVSLDATPLELTIDDNDTATLNIAESTVAPETNGNKQVVVTLRTSNGEGGTAIVAPGVSFSASVVDLANGTATRLTDYNTLTSVLVPFGINDGDGTQRLVPVNVIGDSLIEGNETVKLRMRDLNNTVSGQVSLGTTDGTLIIDDNDTARIEIVSQSIPENGGSKAIVTRLVTSNGEGGTANLASGISVTASVTDKLTGTAISGTDYSAFSGVTLSFAGTAGNGATQTFNLTPINDSISEAPETIALGLGALSSSLDGQVTVSPNGLVTILDDEVATVSVQNAEVIEGNSGTRTLSFDVVLTGTVQGSVSFDYETANNTATAGSDYVAIPRTTRTFASTASGATEKISVTVNGDTVGETTEFFDLILSNLQASGAPIHFSGGNTTLSAQGRIVNDDVALRVTLVSGVLNLIDPAGATGTDSNVRVLFRPETNEYLVRAGSAVLGDVDGNTLSEVKFPASQVLSINADLGGGRDTLTLTGITLNSVVNAGPGDDLVFGGAGVDQLIGADGNDTLYGNEGNDVILGGGGIDVIVGGIGNDVLRGQGATDDIDGGLGIDTIDGGAGELLAHDDVEGLVQVTGVGYTSTRGDRLLLDAGSFIRGLELRGGDGADTFLAPDFVDGNLTLLGNGGNDTLYGGAGNDIILGGAGNDVLQGRAGRDFMQGGLGDDVVRGQGGTDTIGGGLGNDRLDGSIGTNVLQEEVDANMVLSTVAGTVPVSKLSGIGTDVLEGDFTSAILIGGASNNVLDARTFNGDVTIIGGGGNDLIYGSNVRAVVDGGDGNDTIFGGAGSDLLAGGNGNDSISGAGAADKILGGSGNDTLNGGTGTDLVLGEEGDDSVVGELGADRLSGGGNGIARSAGDVVVSETPDEVIDSLFFNFQPLLTAILRLT